MMTAVAKAGKRLVAVGEHGYIVLSDDDGATWRQAKSVPVRVLLTAVGFANEQRGWAVGHSGVVLCTEDGGETWVEQLDGIKAARIVLDSVQANPIKTKTADSSGPVESPLVSAQRLVSDGPDKPFLGILVESDEKVFIFGAYNLIFHTEDGGKSWQSWRSHVENPKELHLYAMERDGQDLFIVGEQGTVLRSSDNGMTFKKVPVPYIGSFFGMVAAKNGDVVVYGLRGNAFWSGDHGKSWQKIETDVTQYFSSGTELQDGSLVLASVVGDVLMSKDEGRTFQRVPIPLRTAVSDVTQAPGGALIFASLRGAIRIADTKIPAQDTRSGK
jgi:photosystem II stability/assembly factor-like uncharacterized protein